MDIKFKEMSMKLFENLKKAIETRDIQAIQNCIESEKDGEFEEDNCSSDHDCLKIYRGFIKNKLVFEYLEFIEPDKDIWTRSYAMYWLRKDMGTYIYDVCSKTGR